MSASPEIPLIPAGEDASLPHGGNVDAIARQWRCDRAAILDLSTGLHPAGPPEWLGQWLQDHAALAAHYPDRSGEPARSALAAEFGLPASRLCIVAGAQAAIEVVFQAMGWRSMAIEVPCYAEPLRCARRAGCALHAFGSQSPWPAAGVYWCTCPANPSGRGMANGELRRHLDSWRQRVGSIVLDESYMPFAQRRTLGLWPGLIRIGSLTKTFCIPGLRLGYVVADEAVIARLSRWLPPWPGCGLSLHLLPRLLACADQRDARLLQDVRRMHAMLQEFGWEVLPSQASFVLARSPAAMPDFAAHRIMVRHFPEWPQLSGMVRLGFPRDEAGWQRLYRACSDVPD